MQLKILHNIASRSVHLLSGAQHATRELLAAACNKALHAERMFIMRLRGNCWPP
jgi:hypothetical protein